MKWIKASERLPEQTHGYAKQIVMKFQFSDNSQMRISTSNQIHDLVKANIANLDKIEWLDESQASDKDKEIAAPVPGKEEMQRLSNANAIMLDELERIFSAYGYAHTNNVIKYVKEIFSSTKQSNEDKGEQTNHYNKGYEDGFNEGSCFSNPTVAFLTKLIDIIDRYRKSTGETGVGNHVRNEITEYLNSSPKIYNPEPKAVQQAAKEDEIRVELENLFYSISTKDGGHRLSPELCEELAGEVIKIIAGASFNSNQNDDDIEDGFY